MLLLARLVFSRYEVLAVVRQVRMWGRKSGGEARAGAGKISQTSVGA